MAFDKDFGYCCNLVGLRCFHTVMETDSGFFGWGSVLADHRSEAAYSVEDIEVDDEDLEVGFEMSKDIGVVVGRVELENAGSLEFEDVCELVFDRDVEG